jgi:uridine kinase
MRVTGSTKPSNPAAPLVIGVAGGSGSGKTYFAKALKDKLNGFAGRQVCEILYQDSYYFDQSSRFDFDGGSVNFDHPSSLDFELLADHLEQLKSGFTVEVPRYDFVTHARLPVRDCMAVHRIVLVDGILIFHPQRLRGLFDDLIFFDTPEQLRFERRLRRDVVERGRTEEGVKSQFVNQVKPMHDQFVEPTKVFAKHIVKEVSEFGSALNQYFENLKHAIEG